MREREAKVLVDDDFVLPALEHLVPGAGLGPAEHRRVVDTYFDTSSFRLARWGVTLRRREGTGWTVKIPHPSIDDIVLDRDEVDVEGGPGSPPDAAKALVVPFARSAALVQVATIVNDRTTHVWRDESGAPVAELTEDCVNATTGAGESTFREVEVEVAPGVDVETIASVVAALGKGTDAPALPKLIRALGEAAQMPPDVVVPQLVDHPSAADVIGVAVASSVQRLLLHVPAARQGVDPEGVHQARVATRRLRSDLRTFAPLLDDDWATGLREELRWLATELGWVRDADVLDGHLAAALEADADIDASGGSEIRAALARQRSRHRAQLLGHLADRRAVELFDDLVDAARDPKVLPAAARPAVEVMPPLVRKSWKRLRRAVKSAGENPLDPELHQVRLRAKRVRYAAEAVIPAAGRPARKFAKAATSIQTILGDVNDAAVAAAWLEEAARSDLSRRGTFTAGRLAQQLRVGARQNIGDWRRAYQTLERRSEWMDAR